MLINFDNTYAEQMQGFYTPCHSANAPSPTLIKFNYELAAQLGLPLNSLSETELAAIFSGNHSPDGAFPIAQVYAGHQFGGFSQQLGDGRALLLGEVIDAQGQRFDIQLKGSGRTPYSRGGDGKAALGPVLREYIVSEAMYALGIPTTRALAAVTTGEQVMRTEPLPGGVFTRVAASHIRIGTFQYFAARQETEHIQKLADYTIERHYPHLKEAENPYLEMFAAICDTQASLVAQWVLMGFIHGVMNTDNMTVSGETIDYGPCAFMDDYNPATVFSSIDRHGRYAYQNQPSIAQWNLARLAEAILPLFGKDTEKNISHATEILENFPDIYTQYWLAGMRKKLGLYTMREDDLSLANDLLASMEGQQVDYTLLFRQLSDVLNDDEQPTCNLFKDASDFRQWIIQWKERINHEPQSISDCVQSMNQVNPLYIPRNHKVEEALEAAVNEADYSKFELLVTTLNNPFERQDGKEAYSQPAPDNFGPYKTFCGT